MNRLVLTDEQLQQLEPQERAEYINARELVTKTEKDIEGKTDEIERIETLLSNAKAERRQLHATIKNAEKRMDSFEQRVAGGG